MDSREMLLKGISGSWHAAHSVPAEIFNHWKAEAKLLDCSRCDDEVCAFRFKQDRFPEDAGGHSQCLCWAQEFTPLAWRNPDGRVIVMPQEVIDRLKAIL